MLSWLSPSTSPVASVTRHRFQWCNRSSVMDAVGLGCRAYATVSHAGDMEEFGSLWGWWRVWGLERGHVRTTRRCERPWETRRQSGRPWETGGDHGRLGKTLGDWESTGKMTWGLGKWLGQGQGDWGWAGRMPGGWQGSQGTGHGSERLGKGLWDWEKVTRTRGWKRRKRKKWRKMRNCIDGHK